MGKAEWVGERVDTEFPKLPPSPIPLSTPYALKSNFHNQLKLNRKVNLETCLIVKSLSWKDCSKFHPPLTNFPQNNVRTNSFPFMST